jgi:hypothetical protein
MPSPRRSAATLFALAVTLALPASAAATAIDDFTDPGTLSFAINPSQPNQTFTTPAGEPDPGCSTIYRTGWWRIAGTGQHFTVTTAGSNVNTAIAAYDTADTPTTANRIACNDGPSNAATIGFDTVRGHSYLIQAGSVLNSFGVLVLDAEAPRPANDDRGAPLALTAGATTGVDSTGASAEPGELLACAADDYDATVWFRFHAPAIGDAKIAASANFPTAPNPGDTVMTVYRASDGAVLGCNDDAGAGAGASALALRLAAGDYLIQVGGHAFGAGDAGEGLVSARVDFTVDPDLDRDGMPRPGDCNDADPAIHPGAIDVLDDGIDQDCSGADAVDLDRDDDGFQRPTDCDDGDPLRHPGATDTPGDGSDQDCSGGDAPYPLLAATVTGFFTVYRDWTVMSDFRVRNVPAGTTVKVSCAGRGCPFERRTRRVAGARARVSLLALVRGAKLRDGARIRVKLTRPLTVGRVTTWRMRARKLPRRSDRCLPPGARRAVTCRG